MSKCGAGEDGGDQLAKFADGESLQPYMEQD